MSEATEPVSKSLSVYTRATIIGLVLLGFPMIIVTIAHLIERNPANLVFTIPSLVVPLIVAALVWRYGRWALVLAVILALLIGVVDSAYIPYGLGAPNSAFDFVPAFILLIGFLTTLISGVSAFVHRRSPSPRTAAKGAEKAVFPAVAVIVVALTIMSLALNIAARDTVSAEERASFSSASGGKTVVMVMKNVRFQPEQLEVPAGQGIRILLDNHDLFVHTFTVDDLDIDITIGAKGEKVVELPLLKPGSYELSCKVPGHEAMDGTLVLSSQAE